MALPKAFWTDGWLSRLPALPFLPVRGIMGSGPKLRSAEYGRGHAMFWWVFFSSVSMALLVLADVSRAVSTDGLPKLHTNQSYIEDVSRHPTLDILDPMSVFSFVLSQLPPQVQIYPTENYYYFSFHHGGVPFAGNLRLAADDRDKGNIHFTYFRDYAGWFSEEAGQYRLLNGKHGVKVQKVDRLAYRVSYSGLNVLFQLNDLSGVAPPKSLLREGEIYIGPVFDESGIQFFLVYNPKIKLFHYILNEADHLPERLIASGASDQILIGNRTGFAFYRDQLGNRKLLIGVYNGNANVNNYFDGPFDQLPDNFIKGETLRNAIIDLDPDLKGQIDRYGNFLGRQDRFMIAPYKHYWLDSELLGFHKCARANERQNRYYYACFIARDEQ